MHDAARAPQQQHRADNLETGKDKTSKEPMYDYEYTFKRPATDNSQQATSVQDFRFRFTVRSGGSADRRPTQNLVKSHLYIVLFDFFLDYSFSQLTLFQRIHNHKSHWLSQSSLAVDRSHKTNQPSATRYFKVRFNSSI
jgi:hypothetical protein